MQVSLLRRSAVGLALALSIGAPLTPFMHSQGITTGTISGSVGDSTGALVPGAVITVVNTATGVQMATKSNNDGSFSLRDLPIGKYNVTIANAGFAPLALKNIQVDANRTEGLGLEKLQAGSAETVIDVSAAASLLETTQGQVTTSFQSEQITSLPTAGGFDELALLIPGVVDTHADNFSNSNGVGLSVNGERGRANNYELDGQSNNDNSVAGPQAFFGNDEAIAQIQAITNDFSAQYGRNAGSVINYITKSGTNQIHGSAIYRYSGDFTSSLSQGYSKGTQFGFCGAGQTPAADGCAATVVPRYVQNWYGGTLGVPVIKDKLWAFGSTYFYQLAEFGALASSGSALFPTPAGLTELAAAFPNSPGVAILQQLSPYAVATGNPRQTSAATSETITANGTTVTIPFAQFGRQIPTRDTDQEDLGRLDWQATSKDRLYLRYFYQHEPDTPGDDLANGGFDDINDIVQSVGADETHTFGPHWVDQLRYSFQQSTLAFNAGGYNCSITSFANCPSDVSIAGTLTGGGTLSGLGLASNLPQGRIVKNTQVQDNANWTVGQHSITFGGEYDFTNSPNTFLPDSSGVYTFDNLNDFIAGTCASSTACSATLALGNPVIPFKESDIAVYFQDDWKIAPSLTLNLGLRWEFFQQAINLLHNESVAQQTGPAPLWSTSLPLSQTTLPEIPNYYGNYEPRLGFAYNPQFNKKLVVRGGYAINVDPAFYNINLNVATSAPAVTTGMIGCTTGCLPTGGATFATSQAQLSTLIPRGGNPGSDDESNVSSTFRNPLGQTYTLATEYQIRNSAVFEIRYTGNHTSRQFQALNSNPYLLPVATDFPNVVNPNSLCSAASSTLPGGADIGHLHCGSTVVNTVANTAFSIYNSLQTKLTTRDFHGVTATIAYTHSKNIDNTSEIYSNAGDQNAGGNTVAYAQNPLNTDLGERGTSGIDFPNTGSVGLVYRLPILHGGNDFVNHLTNGWRVNTIWVYESGQPYTDFETIQSESPQTNPNDPRTFNSYSDQAFAQANNYGYDTARPILSNKNAPADSLAIYTDTTLPGGGLSGPQLVDYKTGAPVSPAQVRFIANNQLAAQVLGNPYPGSGRNILRGDTTNNVDLSVFKDTKITERFTFRLQADAYDVLNRAYYGTPQNLEGTYLSAPSGFNSFYYQPATGSLVGPGTGTRNMQFTAKILF